MKWIREHKFLTGIVCTVLTLCLVIVLSFLTKGSTGVVGRQIGRAATFIQKPIASASYTVKNGIFKFKDTVAENDELKEENARLKQEITKIRLTARDLQELRELAGAFNYDSAAYDYNMVAANVISLDGTNWFNIFTIDRGADDGIYKNAVVVNGDGLIGIVIEAGSNWAKVLAVIDETNKVSFIVLRDPDMVGIMQGDGNGGLAGFMLDNQAGIIEGDILVTSGMGMNPMYPKGIEIGRITSVEYNTDTQLKTITIEPSVKFGNLRKVAVVL
ncbi:MAG: rod shape-determining protein MreC [Clostridiales bacterium]|nr:rod shape-determining protein MreC [Clostridiales bacterium]